MTEPYAPPTAELSEVLQPKRTIQAWLAFFSALIILLGSWTVLLAANGTTPWTLSWLILIRTIAIFLCGSMLAGAVFRYLQKIRWYWAVLAGPILASMFIMLGVSAYYFAFVYRVGA